MGLVGPHKRDGTVRSAVDIEDSSMRTAVTREQFRCNRSRGRIRKVQFTHMVQGTLLYKTAELSKVSTKLAEWRGAGCRKCLPGLKWGFPGAGANTSADVRNNSHWQCAQALASRNGNRCVWAIGNQEHHSCIPASALDLASTPASFNYKQAVARWERCQQSRKMVAAQSSLLLQKSPT